VRAPWEHRLAVSRRYGSSHPIRPAELQGCGLDLRHVSGARGSRVLSGRWIATHEAQVKTLLSVAFFEIGTHGQVHAHLPALDVDHQRAEISRPVTMLEKRFDRRGLLFRPPYGEYDDTTVEVARTLGLRFILWNVVSGDPDPRLSPERMLEDLKTRLRGGSIVVFHANGKGLHTRAVVEDLSQELLKRGLQPVTVTALLDRCNVSSDHAPLPGNH